MNKQQKNTIYDTKLIFKINAILFLLILTATPTVDISFLFYVLHDKLLPEPHLGNLAVSTSFGLMGTQH